MGLKISNATQIQTDTQTTAKVEKKVVNQNSVITDRAANGDVYNKKASGENLAANAKQRLNATFNAQQNNAAQQTQQENKEINSVTTASVFPKAVGADESQESVLRRTFDEYAFKAGLSDQPVGEGELSPAKMFVEERMAANKAENGGTYRIVNLNNPQPNKVFTGTEWAARQRDGQIRMHPNSEDIDSLKQFKGIGDYNDGMRAADELNKMIDSGLDANDPKVYELIKNWKSNPSFQSGLVDRLDADNFIKAEKYLSQTPYRDVMRIALSATRNDEVIGDDGEPTTTTISQRIAQRADAQVLERLTADSNNPMSKDFLIEAGKRVVKENVGFRYQRDTGSEIPTSVAYANKDAETVLQRLSKNPEVSLELMQDESFVKDVAKFSAIGGKNEGFAQIMVSATSKEMRAAGNGEKIDKALKTLADVYKNPEDIAPGNLNAGEKDQKYISETNAKALATIYENNSETLFEASRRKTSSSFDQKGVSSLFKAMGQYESSKQASLNTTKTKVAELLWRSASESNPELAGNAVDLAKNYAESENSLLLTDAKNADKQQERVADILGAGTDVFGKGGLKYFGVQGMVVETVVKGVAAEVKRDTKGNNVEVAQSIIKEKNLDANAAKKIILLTAFESAATAKVNGQTPATNEEKAKAAEFLKDLRDFNDQLKDGEKILDGNGRLIVAGTAEEIQLARFQDAVSGAGNSSMKNHAQGRQIAEKLQKAMGETANRMGINPK
ncbi:MAG: hypothetical protein H7Z37_02755 [Pyrinomonadaceae bacterium]|nr:hypothetical protein [Pyrinomonadaceae bacterium]